MQSDRGPWSRITGAEGVRRPERGGDMTETSAMKITIMRDGPYVVTGGVPISRQVIEADAEGTSRNWREGEGLRARERYDLCRCGGAANKPFCDSSHETNGFQSDDHANVPHDELAQQIEG